ncbi:MAG TPA: NUDIX domain-containing protein [Candidatus Saccharimonadia bacterium]
MVTAYVVNEDRTKLLMCYHAQLDKWLPAGGWAAEHEAPHETVLRQVTEAAGVRAKHIDGLAPLTDAPLSFVLEASETELSPYELEEEYDAQWLTRDEILRCAGIYDGARRFAQVHLVHLV